MNFPEVASLHLLKDLLIPSSSDGVRRARGPPGLNRSNEYKPQLGAVAQYATKPEPHNRNSCSKNSSFNRFIELCSKRSIASTVLLRLRKAALIGLETPLHTSRKMRQPNSKKGDNCWIESFTGEAVGGTTMSEGGSVGSVVETTCNGSESFGRMSSPLRDEPFNDETPVENPSVLEES